MADSPPRDPEANSSVEKRSERYSRKTEAIGGISHILDDFHATVRYLLAALPKAGFTLGTGDSEAEEADVPFGRDTVHASIKINDAGHCRTNGLLALASG